jgi:hypothetical protein
MNADPASHQQPAGRNASSASRPNRWLRCSHGACRLRGVFGDVRPFRAGETSRRRSGALRPSSHRLSIPVVPGFTTLVALNDAPATPRLPRAPLIGKPVSWRPRKPRSPSSRAPFAPGSRRQASVKRSAKGRRQAHCIGRRSPSACSPSPGCAGPRARASPRSLVTGGSEHNLVPPAPPEGHETAIL